MSGKQYLVISIFALITTAYIIVPKMCPNTMNNLFSKVKTTEVKTPEAETLRFQKVEILIFTRTKYGGTSTAIIYEDTKTGIKYLYIWQGAMHGGPCITRLWEE